ncbi:MAG: exo-alpha-sialidase [Clostridia bacterium]|nr:exo-alpha-sialidase [Clostridia bacterium]
MRYIDLNNDTHRQIVVDREDGQYLGHVSSVLLEDKKTIVAVYPKGHGRGSIVEKMSYDGGLTWTDRLPLPESFVTSMEVPTIFRMTDRAEKERIVLFSGLYPIRKSLSEDNGYTWTELEPIGDYGGIVAMGDVIPLNEPGKYIAMFHDEPNFLYGGDKSERFTFIRYADGDRKKYVRRTDALNDQGEYEFRYSEFLEGDRDVKEENGEVIYVSFLGKRLSFPIFSVDKVISKDGGLTWSEPEAIARHESAHLCEPGMLRLTDGRIAVLMRENSRKHQSFVMISDDDGETFSKPKELSDDLTGDRHTLRRLPDGRICATFRDMGHKSNTHGDWVLWVGTEDDIVNGGDGQYKFRLKDNHPTHSDADCGYPGLHVLPDGTIVAITYGHWQEWENGKNQPYILCVRLNLNEFEEK